MDIIAEPINQTILSHREQAKSVLKSLDTVLENRITYIVQQICKAYKTELHTWQFFNYDYEDSSVGDFGRACYVDYINVHITVVNGNNNLGSLSNDKIILKDGTTWGLDHIPLRWLFEDFEEELTQGCKTYLEQLEKEKELKNIQSKNKKDLIKSIKSKLTPEELKAVMIKPELYK
jgi:hypothetical protein